MLGQAHHFRRFAKEQVPYAVERYTNETRRLYGVLDKRLGEADYLAGDYGIADIATFPWASRHEWQGVALEDFRNVKRWYAAIAARAHVPQGMPGPALARTQRQRQAPASGRRSWRRLSRRQQHFAGPCGGAPG